MQRVYGMTKFRPCIDLHGGQVKQIVGGTLRDDGAPIENHVSERSPAWFGKLYAKDELRGGHVIQLGPGNEEAACQALQAFPVVCRSEAVFPRKMRVSGLMLVQVT